MFPLLVGRMASVADAQALGHRLGTGFVRYRRCTLLAFPQKIGSDHFLVSKSGFPLRPIVQTQRLRGSTLDRSRNGSLASAGTNEKLSLAYRDTELNGG